jgi:hypothetical protein
MLAAAVVGVFVIPGLYVAMQGLRERVHALTGHGRRGERAASPPPGHAGQPEGDPL